MLEEIIQDISRWLSVPVIAAKFHNTIISVIFETAIMLRNATGLNKVVVSGGVFQNRFILERGTTKLFKAGFEVFSQTATPANDGGIALGQLAIASKKRDQLCV
jgi:hydrogenase maturation protein HypF